jgi:hypothetical protein
MTLEKFGEVITKNVLYKGREITGFQKIHLPKRFSSDVGEGTSKRAKRKRCIHCNRQGVRKDVCFFLLS